MKVFSADLHIHTALSPCGWDDMTPPVIVAAALTAELDLIAICDHNAAGNAAAVQEAARGALGVIAGMELTTAEEAHVVGLFPDADAACAAAREVQATLPEGNAVSKRFGEQLLVDASGMIVGREPKMLSAPSALALAEAVALIKRHGGLAVAAHVDRPSYSVISQLGLFPIGVGFDAVEISAAGRGTPKEAAVAAYGLPVLSSSDSHFASDVGSTRTLFELAAPSFEELALALRRCEGRRLWLA